MWSAPVVPASDVCLLIGPSVEKVPACWGRAERIAGAGRQQPNLLYHLSPCVRTHLGELVAA